MDSRKAFAMGMVSRNKPLMVFDWCKAARIIKEKNATEASAGLKDDWEWTGGIIFAHGKQVDRDETYVYLASTWAIPELEIDGEKMDCFVVHPERAEWNEKTYWPEEALDILKTASGNRKERIT